MRLSDFDHSLMLSQSKRLEPIWESLYRNYFRDFVNMTPYPTNGQHQWDGIDRSIQLSNARQVLVDEKWRSKAYPDILLEYLSNAQTGQPGWACKPLRADYIAYAIGPAGVCYLLPVLELQRAWEIYGEEWKLTYGKRIARTKTSTGYYETYNCPVPPNTLYGAMRHLLRQYFPRVSEEECRTLGIGDPE